MIFKMSAAPIFAVPLSVSITAKTDSGPTLQWAGPWATVQHFLGIHVAGGQDMRSIEDQLRRGAEQAFEIKASETLLALAGFHSGRG